MVQQVLTAMLLQQVAAPLHPLEEYVQMLSPKERVGSTRKTGRVVRKADAFISYIRLFFEADDCDFEAAVDT